VCTLYHLCFPFESRLWPLLLCYCCCAAFQEVMLISAIGNKYLQDTKPWDVLKVNPDRAATIVTYAAQIVRVCACVSMRCVLFFKGSYRQYRSALSHHTNKSAARLEQKDRRCHKRGNAGDVSPPGQSCQAFRLTPFVCVGLLRLLCTFPISACPRSCVLIMNAPPDHCCCR
jgi:hypothetical protein